MWEQQMIVVFRRTGERRYSVEAQRPGFPDVMMNPAPGYDPLIPHDMMHLVVEAQLGLTRGIFGQLAAGGGTFQLVVKRDENGRELARTRRRVVARGKKSMKAGREECLQSERATYICWHEWLARSSSRDEKKQAKTMANQAKSVRGAAGVEELHNLNQKKMDEICKHLDQLSARWSSLKVGESMAVRWPDLTVT
jgi:hypothetical protein